MENMGPAPVRDRPERPSLSSPRAALLEFLQQQAEPVRVADVAAAFGQHPNTVREHLDELVLAGLADRKRAPAMGRGRPAWLYEADLAHPEPDARVREYAALAGALARHIATTSADPAADARQAGRSWGHDLIARSYRPATAARSTTPAAARRTVVSALTDLGFDPATNRAATSIALRRCPLLDVARQHPEVVCQVHLGLVQGALAELRSDSHVTHLLPFAEPGACRLHLVPDASGNRTPPNPAPPVPELLEGRP